MKAHDECWKIVEDFYKGTYVPLELSSLMMNIATVHPENLSTKEFTLTLARIARHKATELEQLAQHLEAEGEKTHEDTKEN